MASTYSALAILKIIGYDLSNVKSEWLLKSMRNLQQPDGRYGESCSFIKWVYFYYFWDVMNWIDLLMISTEFGSFMPIHTGAETDLRFIYCAGKRGKAAVDLVFKLFNSIFLTMWYEFSWLMYQLPFVICWEIGVAWTKRKPRSTS